MLSIILLIVQWALISFAVSFNIASFVRYRKMKREDALKVDAIVAYQRGDLEPWDSRYLQEAKQRKRHGYTFNKQYHEDPWDIGVAD